MKFFSLSSCVAALAALSTLASAIPTGNVSELYDGQVIDGLLVARDSNSLDARGKSDVAEQVLKFVKSIIEQVKRDNQVGAIHQRLSPYPLFIFRTQHDPIHRIAGHLRKKSSAEVVSNTQATTG